MLKDYVEIVKGITKTPWLATPECMETILEIVNMRLRGEAFSDEEIRIRLEAVKAERKEERQNPRIQIGGGVGVVSLYGPIFPKSNLMTELSGATSLETFSNDLRELASNDAVRQIVIDMDTPGGSAAMVAETGALIKELRDVKPIYAIANTMAASAGLWLFSQATHAYATPSGKVGSLGVIVTHVDRSEANARAGTKITYITAGRYKAAGNPDEPLSTDALEYIQESVDEVYGEFINAVADGRGKDPQYVRDTFGDAKVHNPKKALEIGMIDGIMSMDSLLNDLVAKNMQSRSASMHGALAHSVHKMRTMYTSTTGGVLLADPKSFSEPGQVDDNADLNRDDSYPDRYDTVPGDEDGSTPSRSDTVSGQHMNTQGGEKMDELLDALMSKLGLSTTGDVDKDGELVKTELDKLTAEVKPIRELNASLDKRRKFAEDYPEEAARMAALEERDRKSAAKEFANSFLDARITMPGKDGTGERTTFGFSANVVNGVEALVGKFSEGTAQLEDFKEFMESLTNAGIVDYGISGSSRPKDEPEFAVPTNPADVRMAFMKAVEKVMADDKLEFEAAFEVAAKQHPELYKAYMSPVVVR